MLMNSSVRYGIISRFLHWTMAILLLAMIGVGVYMTELEKTDSLRPQLYGLHKAVGVTILLLGLIRIVWILISPPPPPSRALQRFEVIIAKSVIGFMYLFMLATPIVGYIMSNAFGKPISYFGLFDLPVLVGQSHELAELMGEAHELFAFAILVLVILHVAGVIKHRLFSKNPEADVLKRML